MNAGTFLALLALGYYLLWRGSQPGRALPPAAVPPPPQVFIPTERPPAERTTGTVPSVPTPPPPPAPVPAPSTVSLRTPEMAAALWTRRKVIEGSPPGNVDDVPLYEHWLRTRYMLRIGVVNITAGPTRESVQSPQARKRFISLYLAGAFSDRHLAAQV